MTSPKQEIIGKSELSRADLEYLYYILVRYYWVFLFVLKFLLFFFVRFYNYLIIRTVTGVSSLYLKCKLIVFRSIEKRLIVINFLLRFLRTNKYFFFR